MITNAELASLTEEDLLETSPLLAGLSSEKIKLRVKKVVRTDEIVTGVDFVITWYGITLGALRAKIKAGKIEWSRS